MRESDLYPNVENFAFYIDSFLELSSCRSSGFDIGPIPFTSIIQYASIYDVEDVEDFVFLIRAMDNKFVQLMKKANNGSSNTNKNNYNKK